MNNKLFKNAVAILASFALVCAVAGCASDKKDEKASNPKKADSSASESKKTDNSESAPASDKTTEELKDASSESAPADTNQGDSNTSSPAPEDTKYGDAEVYKNDNGNYAAKTEDGTEVEFTNENLSKLMAEYQKVQGSGSEEEKKLLDQIQLFLEASPNVSEE